MTCMCGREMLALTNRSGEQVYVDPAAIGGIELSAGHGKPDDSDYAQPLTRVVVQGSVMFVTEPPEAVYVQRQHALAKASTADDPLGWKYLPIQKTTDVGSVNGGAS